MRLQNNIHKVSVFHQNDSIGRPIEKSIRKHCFSKKQDQDGTALTEETRKGHVDEGILITPQQQGFCEPVSCQVRLGSQQGPTILTSKALSRVRLKQERNAGGKWEELSGMGSLGLTQGSLCKSVLN